MKAIQNNYAALVREGQTSCEILLLPDGRILAHNISPRLAALLSAIDPGSAAMKNRSQPLQQEDRNETTPGN